MNKAVLIGNVGNAPEIKTLDSGAKVVSLSIATNESYTNKAGEKVEQTEWHRIEGWNYIADAIEKHVKKGDRIYIEGKIGTQRWTDEQGYERNATKIRATRIEFLGYRREQILNEETKQPKGSNTKKAKKEPAKVVFESKEDDLPF